MIYSYREKLEESQNKEIHKVLDKVYREFFPDKTIERILVDNSLSFQQGGRDLRIILRRPHGLKTQMSIFELLEKAERNDPFCEEFIEEKIRSHKNSMYRDILIEVLSNKEQGTLGWIYTSSADWLSYVKQPENRIEVLILPMQDLRSWFIPRRHQFDSRESCTKLPNGSVYTTVNKVVPYDNPDFKAFIQAHGYFFKEIRLDSLRSL